MHGTRMPLRSNRVRAYAMCGSSNVHHEPCGSAAESAHPRSRIDGVVCAHFYDRFDVNNGWRTKLAHSQVEKLLGEESSSTRRTNGNTSEEFSATVCGATRSPEA